MGGVIIGLLLLGLGLWLAAHSMVRFFANRPGVVIAADGIHIDRVLTRHGFMPWDEIESIAIERFKVSPAIWLPDQRAYRLLITGRYSKSGPDKVIKIGRWFHGDLRSMARFASVASRELARHRDRA